jgi:hypothetical protein
MGCCIDARMRKDLKEISRQEALIASVQGQ